jgi:hypothetical protein
MISNLNDALRAIHCRGELIQQFIASLNGPQKPSRLIHIELDMKCQCQRVDLPAGSLWIRPCEDIDEFVQFCKDKDKVRPHIEMLQKNGFSTMLMVWRGTTYVLIPLKIEAFQVNPTRAALN